MTIKKSNNYKKCIFKQLKNYKKSCSKLSFVSFADQFDDGAEVGPGEAGERVAGGARGALLHVGRVCRPHRHAGEANARTRTYRKSFTRIRNREKTVIKWG